MIDALDCPPLRHSRGRSLLPVLSDPQDAEWDNVAFSEFCQNASGGGGPFSEELSLIHISEPTRPKREYTSG